MIWASNSSVSPATDSFEPGIVARVELTHNGAYGMPVSFTARLRLGQEKFVGGVVSGAFGGSNIPISTKLILVPGEGSTNREQKLWVEFTFRLTSREVWEMQNLRDKNPHADIPVTLKIQAQTLESQFRAFPIDYYKWKSNPNITPSNLLAHHEPGAQGGYGDVLIARGDESALRLMTHALPDVGISVPSSHWIRDYAPAFGLGKFVVVAIPEIERVPADGTELAKRLGGAMDALQKMQQDILKGEWTQCAEDARPALELLNKPELVRPLLKTAGLPASNEQALLDGIHQFYTYAHAFHHRTQGGKVTEETVNADPEDAYLALATTAGLLNLVARKFSRLARDQQS
jgi:hypothetical protein